MLSLSASLNAVNSTESRIRFGRFGHMARRRLCYDFSIYLYLSLTDDSRSSDTDVVNVEGDGEKNSDDDDDDENTDDDDNDNLDDGQDSDASGPISSYLEDLRGGSFVTRKEEGINSSSLKMSEHGHWSEDLVARESETEVLITDCEVSTKNFQEQGINSLQSKRRDSKIGICNTTFVIDKSKGCSSMTYPELSHIYKKPVSVVNPITSSGMKLSAKTSLSKEDHVNSIEASGKLDLVQAVLWSRNKIALALAEIVEGKQPSVVSDDSTCHTDGESEVTSSAEESCSTCASSLESYCRFRETGLGKKKCDLMDRKQTKAPVIRGPNNALASQESRVLDSETRQPLCTNADRQHCFVRRRSLKIAPSSSDLETKSSPHSVKLKNGNVYMPRVNCSPIKRRSATLCKFGKPMKCSGQGTYLERCSAQSPIMSSTSKGLGPTSGHQTSATVCNLGGSVTCNGQGKYLERCPEDSLIVCPGSKALGTPSGPQRSATLCNLEGPVTCNEQGRYLERCSEDSLIMCPGSKDLGTPSGHQRSATLFNFGQGTYLDRCSEDSLIMSPGSKALGTLSGHQTTPLVPRSISPALQSSSSNSKRRRSSKVLRVFKGSVAIDSCSSVETKAACIDHHKETRVTFLEKGDNLPKACRSTSKLTSSTSSPGGLAVLNCPKRSLLLSNVAPDFTSSCQKSNGEDVCKEKRESSPSAVKNWRDQKLSCSKTYSDLVNAQSRGKFPSSSIALRKNSCDNRGYVFDIQDEGVSLNEKNETTEEQTADELNCRRKLLVGNLLRARADKEQVSAADQGGVKSKERVMKSSKKHAFSQSGSSRNSHLLRGLGSDISPLKSNVRKKRSRESVAIDTPESLPSKHAKRGSSCSSYLSLCPVQSSSSSQALSCYRKESTPMKWTNVGNLRLEGFLRQSTKPLSPIRRTVADPRGFVNNAVMSPCKVPGSCDKSFCFDCC